MPSITKKTRSLLKILLPAGLILLLVVVWLSPYPFSANPIGPVKVFRQYPLMGTMTWITLYGDRETAEQAADLVLEELTKVEKVCNIFDTKSEISALNRNAAQTPFRCSELLWQVLLAARHAHTISGGAFDITVKPLMDLWGFYLKRENLPAPEEIERTLANVGLDKVIFDDENRTVKFTVPGLKFDLGGIAKGYAVDRAADAVKALGIRAGIINLGGNLYCFPSPPPRRKTYSIGVKDPQDTEKMVETVEILDLATSTSGNYERYVLIDGNRYSHIINPETGRPIQDMRSVTVITPRAMDADILSTAIFIRGRELAETVCSQLPSTHVMIITCRQGPGPETDFLTFGNIWRRQHGATAGRRESE